MNRITMALMAMALSATSSAVFAEDDPADATNSDTAPLSTPDLAAPPGNRPSVETPGPNAHASIPDAVHGRNDNASIPDARAAAPSPDRAVRH